MRSLAWGNDDYPITQGFGVWNPGTASMYGYAADYGWPSGTHIGLDVGLPKLTKVYSPVSGEVIQSGFAPYFRPNPVYVLQDNGDVAIFGHLWSDTVTEGQKVKPGDMVGYSGEQTVQGTMVPDGTGPHIHFELRQPDNSTPSGYRAIDPSPELSGAVGTPGPTTGGSPGTPTVTDLNPLWERGFLAVAGIAVLLLGVNALGGGSLARSLGKVGRVAALAA